MCHRKHQHTSCMKRFIPITLLILGLCSFFFFEGHQYFSLEFLKLHYKTMILWTEEHYIVASLLCICTYAAFVAISAPGAIFLTLISGLLFGSILGSIYVIVGATLGATLIFMSIKLSFTQVKHSTFTAWIRKLEHGFQKNAFFYLLTLRLIPIFPFFVVNIVPALLNVPLTTYVLATFIGIIPGVLIYTTLGSSLNDILASGQTPNLNIIFEPKILLPILALATLSLLPTLYRRRHS